LPVEADVVAHDTRECPEMAAVRLHLGDYGETFWVPLADTARCPYRHIEPAIRGERDNFPAMVALAEKVVTDRYRRLGIVGALADAVEAQDAVDGCNMEDSVAEGDADRHGHAAGDDRGALGAVLVVELDRMDLAFPAGAGMDDVAIPQDHPTCVRNPAQ